MRGVQIDDLQDESADVVGVCAAKQARSPGRVDGDVLRVVEHDVTVCVGVGGAVEGAEVDEGGRAVWTVGWEELVEEGCGAVEQDGFGAEEEVGVRGFGVLVAVELVLGHDGLIVGVTVDDVGTPTHLTKTKRVSPSAREDRERKRVRPGSLLSQPRAQEEYFD